MGHCDIEPGTLPATFVEELTVLQQPVLPVELNATLEPAADFAKAPTTPATRAAYGSGCRKCAAPSSGGRHPGRRLMPWSAWGAGVDWRHSTSQPSLDGSPPIIERIQALFGNENGIR